MSSPNRLLAPLVVAALVAGAMFLSLPGLPAPAAGAAMPAMLPPEPAPAGVASSADTAVFAGGCFWGVEAVFEHLVGVAEAVSGYSGGAAASPSYEQVSTGTTGHAESVRVIYDPARISYDQLLQVFFAVAHDPTQLDRQGPDVGPQYRSAVFYRNVAQRDAARRYIGKLQDAGVYRQKIVTEVSPLEAFHPAESYHQDYLVRHPTQPYIVINDAPKLEELRRRFPELYRRHG
ncbi:MAG TPA: peptide-methionine (S)-S-oxide reductase MsrA [Gemmatimonadales bacterium]|nr:peptide-methionine (S)-S-oxide reductase MsrA [Gemmatimonadales bacterium]